MFTFTVWKELTLLKGLMTLLKSCTARRLIWGGSFQMQTPEASLVVSG